MRHWPGDAARPAIALHCMMGTGAYWGPVAEGLAGRIDLRGFDMPGHGRSPDWVPGAVDFHTTVTRIAAGMITRPVDLIGHSFGASVALRIAVAAPEAVRSLTLIEPVLFAAAEGTEEWAEMRPHQSHFEDQIAAGDLEPAARGFMGAWGAGVPWEALPEHQRARFCQQMPMVGNISAANFSDPGQIVREGGIEAIDAPVMIIRGDASPPIVARVCEALAARCQDVGTAVIPGGGHMLPVTHARQVRELIAMNLERA